MNENTRVKKFEELAERRINEAIKKLQLIGNLANKSNYSYTDAHVNQIFRAIDGEVRNLKAKFQGKTDRENVFKFK